MTVEERLLGLVPGDIFDTSLAGCGEVDVVGKWLRRMSGREGNEG